MIPAELTEQVQNEGKAFKKDQDVFLETYLQLCIHFGGRRWKKEMEMVFHNIRQEIIPILEGMGMDRMAIQSLCSWAEARVLSQ